MPEEITGTAESGGFDAIWGNAMAADPTPAQAEAPAPTTETPASTPEATPTQETTPAEEAKPASVPVGAPAPTTTDPLAAITDPKIKAEFERLKGLEPIAGKVSEFGDAAVLDMLAPIFKQHDSPAAHVQAVEAAFNGLAAYDPQIRTVMTNAVYNQNRDAYAEWLLTDLGLQRDDIPAFLEWQKNSGQMPTGQVASGAPAFPTPDENGFVQIGNTVFDTSDPLQKEVYDLKKQAFERQQADTQRQQAWERQQADRAAEERQARQEQAEFSFIQERDHAITKLIEAAPLTKEEFGNDLETVKQMVDGVFTSLLSADKDIPNLIAQGKAVAIAGGTRKDSFGLQIDQKTTQHYQKAREMVTGLFKELAGYRKLAQAGTIQTLPRIPVDAVILEQPKNQPQAQPTQGQHMSYDDIWSTVSGKR